MKLKNIALLTGLLLSNLMLVAMAKDKTEEEIARQQLDTIYARVIAAMKQNNPTQLKTVLQDVLAPGEMREEVLGGVEHTIASGGDANLKKQFAYNLQIQRVAVKGSGATAIVLLWADVIRVDAEGLYGPQGKEHRLQGGIIMQDTWIKMKGRWKLTGSKSLDEKLLVDGKQWKLDKTSGKWKPAATLQKVAPKPQKAIPRTGNAASTHNNN